MAQWTALQETRCFDALTELYRSLNEEDMLAGLWKRRCAMDDTRRGLALVQRGQLEAGQDCFLACLRKATDDPRANKGEMCMWLQEFANCSEELGQWDLLQEYGRLIDNQKLQLEVGWKTQVRLGP